MLMEGVIPLHGRSHRFPNVAAGFSLRPLCRLRLHDTQTETCRYTKVAPTLRMYRGREYALWPESRDLTLHENKIALTRHNRKVHTCRLGIVIRRRLKLPCILVESLDAAHHCPAPESFKELAGQTFLSHCLNPSTSYFI